VEVAVLGAGNGGCAVAFDWAQHGHNVRLFATAEYPGEVPVIAQRDEIVSTGELSGAAPISYAGHDAGRAVSGADLIMVVGPAYAT
jgi:opine dehydrogenase